MDFAPLLWFAAGRFAFGLIERWRWLFFWLELLSIGLYLLIARCLMGIPNPALQGLSIGGVFLLTSVLSRFLAHRHPIEASDPENGGHGRELALGIIDFAWLTILAATLGILCFARSSYPFNEAAPSGNFPSAYWEAELSNTVFLLEKTIDSVFLLGGVLAGCMAILWAGEIWRKQHPTSRLQYVSTTVAAIRMVVAYIAVMVAALYWLGVPLYERMTIITKLLRSL